MESLPIEIWREIILHMDQFSMTRMMQVCREFRRIIDNAEFDELSFEDLCRRGSYVVIGRLIRANLLSKISFWLNAAIVAAISGDHISIVKLLLRLVVYPYTLQIGLERSCEYGRTRIFSLFLNVHPHCNIPKLAELAAKYGRNDIYSIVIAKFGTPNWDRLIETAARYCDSPGHIRIIECGIGNHSDPSKLLDIVCKDDSYAFHIARIVVKYKRIIDWRGKFLSSCKTGNVNLARIAIAESKADLPWNSGLLTACVKCHPNIASLIINSSPNPLDLNRALRYMNGVSGDNAQDIIRVLVRSGFC